MHDTVLHLSGNVKLHAMCLPTNWYDAKSQHDGHHCEWCKGFKLVLYLGAEHRGSWATWAQLVYYKSITKHIQWWCTGTQCISMCNFIITFWINPWGWLSMVAIMCDSFGSDHHSEAIPWCISPFIELMPKSCCFNLALMLNERQRGTHTVIMLYMLHNSFWSMNLSPNCTLFLHSLIFLSFVTFYKSTCLLIKSPSTCSWLQLISHQQSCYTKSEKVHKNCTEGNFWHHPVIKLNCNVGEFIYFVVWHQFGDNNIHLQLSRALMHVHHS